MKISYAITVCNEVEEIQRLLDFLLKHKREQDSITVLVDITKAPDELISLLGQYESHYADHITIWKDKFNNHFANWKNKLGSYCVGDWIFQIDADEYPDEYLISMIQHIIESNPEVDAYWVPRINTVQGLTQEHVKKWGWRVDEYKRVNFPDYQLRLYKNSPDIKWSRKVHEQLIGYKKFGYLPVNEEYCLHHPKTIERQEKQNKFYDTL